MQPTPRLIQFRQQTPADPQKEKPSWGRRAAVVAGGALALGGLYAAMHGQRPKQAPLPERVPTVEPPKPVVSSTPVPSAPSPSPSAPAKLAKISRVKTTPKPTTTGERSILADPAKWDGKISSIPKVKNAAGSLVLDPNHPGTKEIARRHAGWKKAPRTPTDAAARLLGLVQFNERGDDGRFGASDGVGTAWRKGQRAATWVGRGGEAVGDLADIASGRKVENPFYKKSWFKRAVQGAAIAAPILASRKLSKWNRQQVEHAAGAAGVPALEGWRADVLNTARSHLTKSTVGRKIWDQAVERPFFSAKTKNPVLLHAVMQHIVSLDMGGWDVRDPRGRSARVYAPGARRRDRREKSWGEKTDNIRLVRNAALLAATAGLGGTLYYRSQALKGARVPKMTSAQAAAAASAPNVVPFRPSPQVSASAKLTPTNFADRRASLDKVLAATQEHAIDPVTRQMVPDVPPSLKAVARRVGDDATRGVIENAAYGTFRAIKKGTIAGSLVGAGALLGHTKNRPRLGLALGSAAAGAYLARPKKD